MKLLLLAGTREAREVASWLERSGVAAIASFAGVTRAPELPRIETRIGGFGGEAGFRAFVEAEGVTHILDATHPFAARISARTARLAGALGLGYRQLLRPPWEPQLGDDWHPIACEEDAATIIEAGARVFLATGRQTLRRFHGLSGCHLICRQIDPPEKPFPFPNGRYLVGRPPFSVADERALFTRLEIDWLVVKNAGGAASATKLTAARELGLSVAVIARPPQPAGPKAASVEEAVAWIKDQIT
ncbi:MAG: cobalt-precorrin-6A reductase [Pseudomonadota bacterium]